ncbi:MAG TPA: hypothetical protein VM492_12325, partial [Sumerlaeia bacterium]|nr:hypothetical protein [Sumerlaeia bacterium]
MVDGSNPAGRLHRALAQTRATARKAPGRLAWAAWANILADKDEKVLDKPRFFYRLALIMELPGQIKDLIAANAPAAEQEVCLRWFPDVHRAFENLRLDAPIGEFTKRITDVAMYGIEVCWMVLRRCGIERRVEEEELERIVGEIKDLRDEILPAEVIADDVKRFALEKLYVVEQAVRERKIAGPSQVEKAVRSVIAAAAAAPGIRRRACETSGGSRFFRMIDRLAVLSGVVAGRDRIDEAILPSPPGPADEAAKACRETPEAPKAETDAPEAELGEEEDRT